MRSLFRFSSILSLLLHTLFSALLGCAPGEVEPAISAERIRAELTAVRGALEDCRRSDLPRVVHDAVLRTLEQPEKERLGAYIDLKDWIVLREELLCFQRWNPTEPGGDPQRDEFRSQFVRVAQGYADALQERGTDLLLVLIPTRVQVYPDRLPGVPEIGKYEGFDEGYLLLVRDLLEAGVEVIDLLSRFFPERFDETGEDDPLLYQEFDTHWTPRGAALCADIVTERVRRYDWFEPGPGKEGIDFVVSRESERVRLRKTPTHPEHYTTRWFEYVRRPDGEPVKAASAESPILLLGDSFSAMYGYPRGGNLAQLLYARLGQKVDPIVVRGGGSTSVWKSVARRDEGLKNKRLVLWVLTVRPLSLTMVQPVDIFGAGE